MFWTDISDYLGVKVMNLADGNIKLLSQPQISVYCKLFKDNSAALEIAKVPKMRPRTKHFNIKYHHFREHVKAGFVRVLPIDAKDKVVDIFTQPLGKELFYKFREQLLKLSKDDDNIDGSHFVNSSMMKYG